MKSVGDKRSTFARVDLPALDRIDFHVPQRDRVGVRNVYVTLCQVATLEMDAAHEGFEASRRLLMLKGSISENTLDKHLATLEQLGLVEVERRVAANGSGLPNRYVLIDSPPPDAPISDRNDCPPATVAPGAANAQSLPPQRARVNSAKKKEEGERERARASDGQPQESGGAQLATGSSDLTGTERAVLAELEQLFANRGRHLLDVDRAAIRDVVHAAPEGVDPVAAAARLRRHYGPDGKAANRPITAIAALLETELRSSTPRRTGEPARRKRRLRASDTRSAAARAAERAKLAPLTVHDQRPPGLEAPDSELQRAWRHAKNDAPIGIEPWVNGLELAGSLDDVESLQRVIVLEGSRHVVEHVAANGRRWGLIRIFEQLLSPQMAEGDVTVELAVCAEPERRVA